MATYTSHYNLKKPATTDPVLVGDLNDNFDTIDQKIYEAMSSGGSATGMIEQASESTDTSAHAYSIGEHFIYNNTLYRATAAIAIGDTITPGTNCTAVTVAGELEGKQNTLTFDSTPTDGSSNPVTSGGVYTALTGKANDSIVATVETSSTSAHAYAIGDLFILNGVLYKATVAIAVGGTITAGTNCQTATVGGEVSDLKNTLSLLDDEIPDTVQTITFDQNGNVQSIAHSRNNVAVRTDVFTFAANSVTEVRTLSTGQSLTIVTNLSTLETTITYSEGGN